MRLPQVKTLFSTAVGVAIVGTGSILYFQLKQLEQISNSEFFREAFKILRSHKGAISHLGEPIKQKGFKLGDAENFLTSENAQFKVNVSGPNDKGKLHLWAKPTDGVWSVTRIELELNKHPDKRLLIKDGPKNDNQEIQQQNEQISNAFTSF